jgi:hypothetical protein
MDKSLFNQINGIHTYINIFLDKDTMSSKEIFDDNTQINISFSKENHSKIMSGSDRSNKAVNNSQYDEAVTYSVTQIHPGDSSSRIEEKKMSNRSIAKRLNDRSMDVLSKYKPPSSRSPKNILKITGRSKELEDPETIEVSGNFISKNMFLNNKSKRHRFTPIAETVGESSKSHLPLKRKEIRDSSNFSNQIENDIVKYREAELDPTK